MSALDTAGLLITLVAAFGYLNLRFFRLPTSIGLMLIALLISAGILGLGMVGVPVEASARQVLQSIDFERTLMKGMLGFLLFAGALHVDLEDLAREKGVIAFLATVGVILSTAVVGLATYWLFRWLGQPVSLLEGLLFGVIISPTDPIAVLSMLRSAGADRSLEARIAGESLFNDGVAVVGFTVLLAAAFGAHEPNVGSVVLLIAQQAVGGALFGLAIGYAAYRVLRSIDNYQVETLVTLAVVMGGYSLAGALQVSGPIAMVVAGLLIGSYGKRYAMSDHTRQHLFSFWELLDALLNAVLFVMMGFELLLLTFTREIVWAGVLTIPIVLLARLGVVLLPPILPRLRRKFTPAVIRLLVWGGLRGGLSVAMALSLPAGSARNTIIAITYLVVLFSILV
ncbi:MAG TPA: sodium:proton antiporter, partial [bacterium]|nr:sodium:proton antiporter [bacterium]